MMCGLCWELFGTPFACRCADNGENRYNSAFEGESVAVKKKRAVKRKPVKLGTGNSDPKKPKKVKK